MKRIAVFVATTNGPVRVERVTRERAPQSMVCLKRSSTVLPISAAYDSFVRLGSGVVERVFGPFESGAFRLDLSAPIETGESWQLGFFVAHAIAASLDATLSTEDDADAIIWLTGRVDYDLAVGSVSHIAEKMHASRAAISKWIAQGSSVTLFVPSGADRDSAAAAGLPPGLPPDAPLVAVSSARDVLTALDLSVPGAASAPNRALLPALLPARRSTAPRWIAACIGATAILASAMIIQSPHGPSARGDEQAKALPAAAPPAPALSKPMVAVAERAETTAQAVPPTPQAAPAAAQAPEIAPKNLSKLSLYELRAPSGHNCAEVQFDAVAAVEREVAATDEITVSALAGLCGLGVVVDNGLQARRVTVTLDVVSGKLLYGTVRPDFFSGQTAFDGRREWAIDLPRKLHEPFEIRVTALSAPEVIAQKVAFGAADAGVTAATLHHRVIP